MAEPRAQLVLANLLQRAASLKDEPGWEPLRPERLRYRAGVRMTRFFDERFEG